MTKKIISLAVAVLLLGSSVAFAITKPAPGENLAGLSYKFYLYYDNGQLFADRDYEIKYDLINESFVQEPITTQSPFKAEIVNFKYEVVGTFQFDPQKGDSDFKTGKVTVKGPYVVDGQRINFYGPNGINVFSVFVREAAICNNNDVCSALDGENESTCPSDCKQARTPISSPAAYVGEDSGFLGDIFGGDLNLNIILIYIVGSAGVLAIAWFGWKWWKKKKEGFFSVAPSSPPVAKQPAKPDTSAQKEVSDVLSPKNEWQGSDFSGSSTNSDKTTPPQAPSPPPPNEILSQ